MLSFWVEGAPEPARVLAALLRMGWSIKREGGSHRTLSREGFPDYTFAFHDRDEIGPRMLARVAQHTGPHPRTSSSGLAPLAGVSAPANIALRWIRGRSSFRTAS